MSVAFSLLVSIDLCHQQICYEKNVQYSNGMKYKITPA